MAKKFFLRKSHSDLVQEQNRMLQTLLDQQQKIPQNDGSTVIEKIEYKYPASTVTVESEDLLTDSTTFDFDDDIAPYIHINTTDSAAQLHVIETDKVNFDEENVEKLKKARSSKRN